MKKEAIVLYPCPVIGHLVSMVEFGKLLLTHQPYPLSVIILLTTPPGDSTGATTTPYINCISSTTPSITFHHLPVLAHSPLSSTTFIDQLFEIHKLQNPNFLNALQALSQNFVVKSVVLDFFCDAAFQVSTSLNIPTTYYFYTSGASGLAQFLYLPTLDEILPKSIRDLNDYIHMPGSPPIYCLDMPEPLYDKNTPTYENFTRTARNMRKCAGLFANTFEAFEPRAVKAILEGECNPNGPTPPFYGIGPLVASQDMSSRSEHECLIWLDSQPCRSVVFLCFGSMGLFSQKQLVDMAIGLEKSGHRFLWVVRNPTPLGDATQCILAEPDLDALLPHGFLERTKDKGLVVKSWAPQVDVLSHDSVGGFVTHCGWNSALEAVLAGVPMLGWPLYAEQRMNRVILVEGLKVALPVKETGEDRFMNANELVDRVTELMDAKGGKVVRDRVMEMRDAAKAATRVNGSSRVALAKFLECLKA